MYYVFMAFKLMNTEAVKLNSDELIKEAFDSYCAHIAKGKVVNSWYFKKDGKLLCCYTTMERYVKNRPDVCCPTQYNASVSMGLGDWENVVDASAKGEGRKGNPATLQIVMRNKYGWDTKADEDKATETAMADLKALASAISSAREQRVEQSKDRND